jgi:hypothetical protein
LPKDNPSKTLGFFFQHLDATDDTVASDAFVELARASDADIVKARGVLDARRIRGWLSDAKTPDDRIGVYGMLLGLCGSADDARWLHTQLTTPNERTQANFGGLLTGLILLDAKTGWGLAERVLANPTRVLSEKLNVISALRFFQATRPVETKPAILACYQQVIAAGDLADVAIDDLRRWGWWELTERILPLYGPAPGTSPILRRGVVRYALQCPHPPAKTLIETVRTSDSKLLQQVEASLRK